MPSSMPSSLPSRRPATVRVARWSATHPWRAIAMWLVFVTAAIAVGQAVGLRSVTNLQTTTGQSGRAAHMLHDAHLVNPATENVLITARHGTLPAAAARRAAQDLTATMSRLPEVLRVDPVRFAPDGSAAVVHVSMTGDPQNASDHVTPLLTATAAVAQHTPDLRIEEVGSASLDKAVNDQVGKDLGTAANVSLPVTLLILVIAFGAIVAAGVPLLLALSAVGSAIGLSAAVSHVIPDSGTTSSMILLMGMAVGVDYSLFYVKRARAERHRGHTHLDAIEIAAETAGHSVIVSGAAVIVSMLGLFLADDAVFASLAAGSIVVVAVAVLGSITVLPAVLVKLGNRIDRPRVPVLWRLARHEPGGGLWGRLLRPAVQHPVRTLTLSVLGLALLCAPALDMTLHSDTPASLPKSITAATTFDRLAAAFPGEHATEEVVVRAPAAQSGAVELRMQLLARRLDLDPSFVRGATVQTSADRTVHLLRVDAPFDPESAAAKRGVRALRAELVPHELAGLHGVQWAVGGDTASTIDADAHGSARLPWVIAAVVLMTMIIMAWVFRSVVIALLTAVLNLLSVGAAFGVLVLTFQHRWAEGLLNFHSSGAIVTWIPLFTFAVLFGLSMDYHVFVLNQVREAAQQGLPTKQAISAGITRSATTVTSAAVVMVSVFAIFASLHMIEMKELGVGLAVAVLVDALVVRVVVLPSLLVLVGRWLWWPGEHPRRLQPADVTAPELVTAGV